MERMGIQEIIEIYKNWYDTKLEWYIAKLLLNIPELVPKILQSIPDQAFTIT